MRELRQLRDGAGLGHAELAARAHYPYDSIRAAEVGPSLPDLPVLSAFVRGCGGTTEEWEERWRSLTRSPSLPVSATRQTGQSDASTAGARIGSVTQAENGPDPSIIIAALNRVAEEMASPATDAVPAPPHPQPLPSLPPASPLSSDEPGGKPTGWDPIRVSSAWPALPHTPTVAKPAADTGSSGGVGAPWEAASWAEDPADAAPSASSGAVGAAAGTRAAGGTSASVTGDGAVSRGGSGRTPRTTIVVPAVVLLCVLAVLLAIFA